MELVLTGRRIDAAEAQRLGFVNQVAPRRGVARRRGRAGIRGGRRPPLAVRFGKQAVLAADETPLSAGLESGAALVRAGDGDRGPRRGHDRLRREAPAGVPRAVILGVVGAGTMGAGIAQLGCAAGIARCSTTRSRRRSRPASGVRDGLERWVAKGRVDARAADLLEDRRRARQLAGCELVIEAAPERPDLKRELFAELSRGLRPRRGARHQHELDPGDVARRGAAPGERGRDALLQPAPADGAARGDPRRPDRRPGAGRGERGRRGDGQARDPRRRRPGLPRQPLRPAVLGRGAAAARRARRHRTSRSTASAAWAAASGWGRSS